MLSQAIGKRFLQRVKDKRDRVLAGDKKLEVYDKAVGDLQSLLPSTVKDLAAVAGPMSKAVYFVSEKGLELTQAELKRDGSNVEVTCTKLVETISRLHTLLFQAAHGQLKDFQPSDSWETAYCNIILTSLEEPLTVVANGNHFKMVLATFPHLMSNDTLVALAEGRQQVKDVLSNMGTWQARMGVLGHRPNLVDDDALLSSPPCPLPLLIPPVLL
eukprot:5549495-Pyramimonas_sp.AAC.1